MRNESERWSDRTWRGILVPQLEGGITPLQLHASGEKGRNRRRGYSTSLVVEDDERLKEGRVQPNFESSVIEVMTRSSSPCRIYAAL